jgi:hypothetical protein
MEIALFWLFFAVIVGVIAANRGRSGFGWFLLSLVISPLLGAVLVLALGAPRVDPSRDGDHKKCPSCAEWVKREAIKCKHCGEALTLATTTAGTSAGAYEVVRPSPGSEAFGRALGRFVARNRTTVVVVAGAVLLWLIYRQFVRV